MKKFSLLLSIALIASGSHATAQMGKLYKLSASPYASNIAHKAGDLLSVIVEESATTTDQGNRKLEKEDDLTFSLKKFFFPHFKPNVGFDDTISSGTEPGFDLNAKREYEAKSESDSKHSFMTTLQVRIIEEVTNGQFLVQGKRDVNINGKNRTIYVSGVIRSDDIDHANQIKSHLIADAVVEIDGDIVSEDLEPGMMSNILSKIFF